MTLLWMDGFDAADVTSKWPNSNIANTTSGTRFGYGKCVQLGSTGASPSLRKSFTASTKVIFGQAYMTDGSGNQFSWFTLYGDAGSTPHITIIQRNLGVVNIERGPTGSQTVLASSAAGAWSNNVWHYVEVSATISDTTGTVVVKVDGATVVTYTGDTKNGGTANSVDMIEWQAYNGGGIHVWVDDLYIANDQGTINNDFLGDSRVYTLSPTGAGANTGWTPSTAPNWDCVNELPASSTDYVFAGSAGLRDTYACADLPGSPAAVFGVNAVAIAKKTDAANRTVKTVIRRGSTDYVDTTGLALSTADNVAVGLRETDPSTSAAWTVANVNAMEIGVESG
jgi:hypothetical protein